MNSTNERRALSWLRFAAAATMAWLVPFACAESDESGGDRSPDANGLDSGLLDADAHADSPSDANAPHACSGGGFCYVAVPPAMPLTGVAGQSGDEVWVVGDSAILRRSGNAWDRVYQYIASGDGFRFQSLWVPQRDDAWAIAQDELSRAFIVRYSASDAGAPVFREIQTDEVIGGRSETWLAGTWATAQSDALWAAMSTGAVLRFREGQRDGPMAIDRWTPRSTNGSETFTWTSIWGFGPDDVYVGGAACDPAVPFGCVGVRSVLGHFDGTVFSVATLDRGKSVVSMFGTPPGQPRQLWITSWSSYFEPTTTTLVPVLAGGAVGAPLFSRSLTPASSEPAYRPPHGAMSSSGTGWISNGSLVWRWTGTALEPTAISLRGLPVGEVNAIWAGTDDAWIVGRAVPAGTDSPPMGFAARHASSTGGEP